MKNFKGLELFISALSWVAFIGLSIGLGYFVRNIWMDFQSKKTSQRVYTEIVENFLHPTISLCFDPMANTSALKEYDMKLKDLVYSLKTPNTTMNALKFYQKVGFQLGRDFTISLMIAGENEMAKITITNVTHDFIDVEEVIHDGGSLCYILTFNENFKTPPQTLNTFQIDFEANYNLPLVNVFLSSSPNSYGIHSYKWLEGDIINLKLDANEKTVARVSLKSERIEELKEASDCKDDNGYYVCFIQK